MRISDIPLELRQRLRKGVVIPAHPLALDENRRLDSRYQRALCRYYVDAGAGGIAVGVHSTQFEIRDPDVGLFRPVLELASRTIDERAASRKVMVLKVAGVCGRARQALGEAEFARDAGFHACLLSLAALRESETAELIRHCRQVASVIPVIGFYLQPSVGGRVLPFDFWRQFAEIENVLAIKIAPFNRYQTLDVVRAVCEAEREDEIALYTGNDDNIVIDLLSEYRFPTGAGERSVRIVGGLLGHWAVWTRKAATLLEEIHATIASGSGVSAELLARAVQITDTNAAFFDPAHGFAGCIPGIHEVLRRQGLMRGTWCLNRKEVLSPGQSEEIDRVYRMYPNLNDDEFVRENLAEWLEE